MLLLEDLTSIRSPAMTVLRLISLALTFRRAIMTHSLIESTSRSPSQMTTDPLGLLLPEISLSTTTTAPLIQPYRQCNGPTLATTLKLRSIAETGPRLNTQSRP